MGGAGCSLRVAGLDIGVAAKVPGQSWMEFVQVHTWSWCALSAWCYQVDAGPGFMVEGDPGSLVA